MHSQPVGRHCVEFFVLEENRGDSLKRAKLQICWKSNDLHKQVVLLGGVNKTRHCSSKAGDLHVEWTIRAAPQLQTLKVKLVVILKNERVSFLGCNLKYK